MPKATAVDDPSTIDRPARLVARGNAKLGSGIWHTNLPAGLSCPGASEWCADPEEGACYATRGFYVVQRTRYRSILDYLRDEPDAYREQLLEEVSRLRPGSVFRFHTSGDLESVRHIRIVRDVVMSRPDVPFYLYTRSWRIPALRRAIERYLFGLPNLTVWGSCDATTDEPPDGWRSARVFPTADAVQGYGPVCPEQTGRRASCSDCGLCWRARAGARLAFLQH